MSKKEKKKALDSCITNSNINHLNPLMINENFCRVEIILKKKSYA